MEKDNTEATIRDVEGNEYRTVKIGMQVWMAENLRVAHKPDGAPVKSYAPNDDPNNVKAYGYLYDWETACRVCPPDWHLPSEAEWATLESYLGNSAAGKLKDIGYWKSPNTGATNETGLSARPAGYYNDQGFENNFGLRCIFWCSTRRDTHFIWTRVLSYDHADLRRAHQHPQYGFSIRCVKDDLRQ